MRYIVDETVVTGAVEDVFDLVAGVEPDTRFAERPGHDHRGGVVRYTAYQRPYLLTSMTALRGAILHDTLRFEPAPGGTRIRWMCSVDPTGVFRLLGPAVGAVAERRARRTWAALRADLENHTRTAPRLAAVPSLP